MVSIPRLVIAAPASGSGKTTVATGLMAALRHAGRRVAGFKVGPDYIDPGYHAVATGRPGRNLDPILVGQHRIGPLFAHGAAGCDIAVVEGVMGLFDGRIATCAGSTAHVARLLNAPILLVVDTQGQGQSLAALLHGFRSYSPGLRIAGVLLNRVGSMRHVEVLRAAADEVGLPVLGALPRHSKLEVPSRHLGLVPAAEYATAAARAVQAMCDVVAEHVDIEALIRIASTAAANTHPAWNPGDEMSGLPKGNSRPVVAVAGGRAFTFGYAEHVELLRSAGAQVAVLDPLHDKELPEGATGVILPGGFPEEHAAELSENVPLRAQIAALAGAGRPVHAECGGLLYLCRELDGRPMCGVLDARASMSGDLVLGYRDVVAAGDSAVWTAGSRTTGHEFHRSRVVPDAVPTPAWHWRGSNGSTAEGFVYRGVHASYLHTHPAASPAAVARFVAMATDDFGSDDE